MNRKSYRALVLLLLTIVYGFNFIDRQIVGILAPFIQADLGLTNTQLGLLIGLAFAVLYTTVAIPIAWLADKYNRVNILSIALATWSGFTALTGLANNFLQIAIARMGVGIGEAGGSPPSHSIIFDAGTGQRDIRRVVESLTDLPITFIPSHLHYDHIGNEVVFEETALVDLPHLRKRATDNKLPLTRFEHLGEVEGYSLPELKISEWLTPNETIDLGNRLLLVLYTPGHTQDSISLFDQEAGYLFSGDFLYPGQLYGFLPNSNMGDYLQGAQTIESVSGNRLRVFGAHRDDSLGVPELSLETVTKLQNTLNAIQSGTLKSNGTYPVTYKVNDRVELLSEPKWLQDWDPIYPELNLKSK